MAFASANWEPKAPHAHARAMAVAELSGCMTRNVSKVHILGNGVLPKMLAMARDDQLARVRRERIQAIIDTKFKGNKTAFALKIGKSPAQVGHWVSGHRNPNGDTCREIEDRIEYPRDWIDGLDLEEALQAHGVSYASDTVPYLSKEELMERKDALQGEFWFDLWDDAIGYPAGTRVLFVAGSAAAPSDFVLILAGGRLYVREFAEDLAEGWVGRPLKDSYATLRPSEGAAVIAVFESARGRRSQLRR